LELVNLYTSSTVIIDQARTDRVDAGEAGDWILYAGVDTFKVTTASACPMSITHYDQCTV